MDGIVDVLRSTLVPDTQKAAEAKLEEVSIRLDIDVNTESINVIML